jgi:hypothetical protein
LSTSTNEVTLKIFKEYVMRDLKTNITLKDMDIFLKSHVAAQAGILKKRDLLEIFDEPFRVAKYQALERESYA